MIFSRPLGAWHTCSHLTTKDLFSHILPFCLLASASFCRTLVSPTYPSLKLNKETEWVELHHVPGDHLCRVEFGQAVRQHFWNKSTRGILHGIKSHFPTGSGLPLKMKDGILWSDLIRINEAMQSVAMAGGRRYVSTGRRRGKQNQQNDGNAVQVVVSSHWPRVERCSRGPGGILSTASFHQFINPVSIITLYVLTPIPKWLKPPQVSVRTLLQMTGSCFGFRCFMLIIIHWKAFMETLLE